MLRGAIDDLSPWRIGGWIYSDSGSVRDRKVLAFVDSACVGAGTINLYRDDLAQAGLGDGYLGFNFELHLEQPQDAHRTTIRLEGSDFLLLPSSAQIISTVRPASSLVDRYSTASIEWMRTRGWLEQKELDFLKMLSTFGVYDLSLRLSKSTEKATGAAQIEPKAAAREMFSLLNAQQVEVQAQTFGEIAELPVPRADQEPLVALWSARRGAVLVVEGSHRDQHDPSEPNLDGAVEYEVGPDRLLFLDRRCIYGAHERSVGEIQVFMFAQDVVT